jgi:hypothetical protein
MGVAADDSDDVRVQKVTLTVAKVTVTGLAVAYFGRLGAIRSIGRGPLLVDLGEPPR